MWLCICVCFQPPIFNWLALAAAPAARSRILPAFPSCHLQPRFHPSAGGRVRVYSDNWVIFPTFESIPRVKVHFERVSRPPRVSATSFAVRHQMRAPLLNAMPVFFFSAFSFVSGLRPVGRRVVRGGGPLIYMTRSSKLPTSEILSCTAAATAAAAEE